MEDFYTIQGEGFHQGKAAYFIRLGGCEVGCHWCDVKDSWDVSKFPLVEVEELAKKAAAHPSKVVVITGGEPLMHNLDFLTQALKNSQLNTHIETSGTYPVTGQWDWICLSPKKFKQPIPEVLVLADEFKVIVFNKSDFAWAESFRNQLKENCKLYLQPEWSKQKEMLPLIIDYVKNHPEWEISLQIHKFLDIP